MVLRLLWIVGRHTPENWINQARQCVMYYRIRIIIKFGRNLIWAWTLIICIVFFDQKIICIVDKKNLSFSEKTCYRHFLFVVVWNLFELSFKQHSDGDSIAQNDKTMIRVYMMGSFQTTFGIRRALSNNS